MKYTFEKLSSPPQPELTGNDMSIGDIAEITSTGLYKGGIILRHYDGWVMLNAPSGTWRASTGCAVSIRPLTAGETVVLKVTE